MPPEWSVPKYPGQHLSTVEGALTERWCAEPEITLAQLLRQLDHVARGTQRSCSYQSQESYFRFKQGINKVTRAYEAEQGCQY